MDVAIRVLVLARVEELLHEAELDDPFCSVELEQIAENKSGDGKIANYCPSMRSLLVFLTHLAASDCLSWEICVFSNFCRATISLRDR